jgi:hypothetical protein
MRSTPRPDRGVRDDESEHRRAEPEPEDRQRNERDRRDRSQELDHDRRPVLDRPRAADRDPEPDADGDGEREALDVDLERRHDLVRERPVPELVGEGARRFRGRRDAVFEIEEPHSGLGEHEGRCGEEQAGDVRPPQERTPYLTRSPAVNVSGISSNSL